MLVSQQSSLIPHVTKKYDHASKKLFDDANTWVALTKIFTNILQDPAMKGAYLIISALDECVTGLPQLFDLIVQNRSLSPRVKWIISSRNQPNVEHQLNFSDGAGSAKLSLELNVDLVSQAIGAYIAHKVRQLNPTQHDKGPRDQVRNQMRQKVNDTFLWAAFVFKEFHD